MIYVTSDLHGYPLKNFQKLLKKADFRDEDLLFVLGDVIDRREEGPALLRWMIQQPNVELILGNHEAMLLACRFLFQEVTDESLDGLSVEKLQLYARWRKNGGGVTLSGLRKLLKEDPEVLEGILEYLEDAPLYQWVEAGARRFLLVHGGLADFREDRLLEDYRPEELFWTRPTADTRFFHNATVILGHTPTQYFGTPGKAFHGPGWIGIDTGEIPMLLRLDDGTEFYP